MKSDMKEIFMKQFRVKGETSFLFIYSFFTTSSPQTKMENFPPPFINNSENVLNVKEKGK